MIIGQREDVGVKHHCSLCGVEGHNRRTHGKEVRMESEKETENGGDESAETRETEKTTTTEKTRETGDAAGERGDKSQERTRE